MAFDFLSLVNDVNRRLNEVELTSANFDGAIGYYAHAKDAVNSAIRHINFEQFEWPFNHVTQDETLSVGVTRYAFPSDIKSADMDTFRIKANTTFNNRTQKLRILSYEEYLDKYVDQEYNSTVTDTPRYVFKTPDMGYGVSPAPKEAYEIVYEYYRVPVDLISSTDVPTVPEVFRHVINDGAMYYAYMFRSDLEASQLSLQKFQQGIKDMRTIYINRYDYARSTMIER
ncbi:MAG: hypothetical protein ACRCT2_01200 [Plesiomonas shigelloides]